MKHQHLTDKSAKGMKVLFMIQIFSTLSFSILYSSLILYATKGLKIDTSLAIGMTGSFVAFNYFLHLLGGYIGGRLISYRDLFCIGMLFQALGCVIISLYSVPSLFWGLAAFLTGCGLNVTCVNCMLTQLFEPHDKNRETAFLWNYSGMNIGFLIGFTISGIFQITSAYSSLFFAAALSNIIALVIALFNWKILSDVDTPLSKVPLNKKSLLIALGLLCIILLFIALRYLLHHEQFSNAFIILIGILMLLTIALFAFLEKTKEAKKKLWAFFVLIFASLIFWTLFQMAPMGLLLFLTNNVSRVIHHFPVPPQWFFNINTLLIIIGGPTMAFLNKKMRARGHHISIPLQFTLALFLIGLAFVILTIGISFPDSSGKTAFYWVVISYILQSLGELFISPIGYAMIGQLIPQKLQGLMMGTWMMIVGVAATVSNYFSQAIFHGIPADDLAETNPLFMRTFSFLGWGAIAGGVLMLILIPFLNHLIQEKKSPEHVTPHPYNAPEDTP